MTVLEDVADYVKQASPHPVCDDCISAALGVTPRQHINHKTRELADWPGFDRRVDVCNQCGKTKKSIRSI